MKEQNTKVLVTITIVLAVALAAGLMVVPAIEQQEAEGAKSVIRQCASYPRNASSSSFCSSLQ